MRNSFTKDAKSLSTNLDNALLVALAEEIGEYLSIVARRMTKTLGGEEKDYDGFCFIGRDRKTLKLRAQLVMNVRSRRLSATFNGSDVEDLERFAHAWANHTIITQNVSSK